MSKVESVKVAVRVRPYNDREKDAGSKCIIRARVCGVAQVAPERGHGSSLWRARRARWPGCAARGSQPRLWHATARPIIVARAATTPPRRLPPPVASHASSTALTSHVSPLAAHRARLASPAQMKGAVTSLINPETQEEKDFAFDFSYWSHGRFNQPNQPP